MSWYRVDSAGLWLELHVQPGAKHTACAGLHGERLKVRLAAPPVDGKANLALQRWLAEVFAVPRARVTLIRGDTARDKTWCVAGCAQLPEAWQVWAA